MQRRSRAPEYMAWIDMRRRCYDQTRPAFHNYGGRGITVCDEWNASFEAFLVCVGQRPSPEHSIERVNNDGNYVPGNVCWATRTEQSRNRRNVTLLTFRGETLALSAWAKRAGVERHALRDRIVNLGWDVGRALTTPTPNGKPIAFKGESLTLNAWARRTGIPQGTLWYRLFRLEWDLERTLTTPSGTQSPS